MARKSGWQQFADNFNAVYDAGNKFAKDSAFRELNERKAEEQFGEDGASTGWKLGETLYEAEPTPEQIRMQNVTDTQGIMHKFGDHKDAMDMGLKYADLVERRNQNKLFQDTYDTKIEKLEADLAAVKKTNEGLDTKNNVAASQGDATILEAERKTLVNGILLDYSKRIQSGEWKDNPGAGKQFLLNAFNATGDQQFYTMVNNMDESAINQKLNGAAQLMASVKVALGKGQAGGQKELMALIDAQDGITGNIRFDTDESGAVSIVELDQEGNPTNAAPWAGKDWEEFSQNVMKRLDPVTALNITTKQVGLAKDKASVKLIIAQSLEALHKAGDSGDEDKLNAIKQKAVADYMNNPESGWAMHKRQGNMEAAEADLALFKAELQKALDGNKKTNTNTGGLGGSSTGGSNDTVVLGKLANLNNSINAGNQEPTSDAPPVKKVLPKAQTSELAAVNKEIEDLQSKVSELFGVSLTHPGKKVLTKAQTSELAALDKEIEDLQSKVSELSKVRGLNAGGKVRSEIQKIRALITGIEQRKHKIQN